MATQSATSPSSLGSMPGASGEALIKMEGIKKIFYTDEVETHALSDIHLEIRPGEYIAIAGPSTSVTTPRSAPSVALAVIVHGTDTTEHATALRVGFDHKLVP